MLVTLAEQATGIKMFITHDTEVSLTASAALVNTGSRGREDLPDIAALDAYLRDYRWTGRHDRSEAELQAVRDLRPRLRALWYEDEHGVVKIVNRLLREASALPQLTAHDGQPYHLHATSHDAPLVTRMAVEAAMAFVDVIRSGELGRLHICDYPDCDNVLVDLSRNRSKRFCDAGCGNRAAVSAYRARKAASRA